MTAAARRVLTFSVIATSLVVAAVVLLWPAVLKSHKTNSEGARTALSDPEIESGSEPAPQVRARPPTLVEPRRVVNAAAISEPPLVALPRAGSPLAAAILDPPQPPRAPPPPKPAEVAIRQRLSVAIAQNPGTELKFVACDEDGAPCRARVQARDMDAVVAAARAASGQYDGHVGIKIHEKLTAMSGRFFVAELQVGTKDQHPVPTDLDPNP